MIDEAIKLPVKVVLLPSRVMCVALDGKHRMGPWRAVHGRWVRECEDCAAEETR